MSSSSEASSESSSEEEIVAKPVFMRSKRSQQPNSSIKVHESTIKDRSIDKIEKLQALQSSDDSLMNRYDGIDDTDDIDPEAEYNAWKKRSEERIKRERQRLAAEEEAKNERYRENQPIDNSTTDDTVLKVAKLGAFFTVDDKFSLRPVDKLQDSEDHSRPTRFKLGGK